MTVPHLLNICVLPRCVTEPDFLLDPPVRLSSSSAGAFYLDSDSVSASTDLVDIRVGSGAEAVTVQVNR